MSQTNTTEDTRIQWHPAFVAAMNLEFRQNKNVSYMAHRTFRETGEAGYISAFGEDENTS